MAQQGPPAQQQGGGSESSDFLWLIVAVVISIALIWYFGKDYISEFVLGVRYYEILAIRFVINGWNLFATSIGLSIISINTELLTKWLEYIQNTSGAVPIPTLVNASKIVGMYLRWPFAVILVVLGAYIYRHHITSKFNQVYSMLKLRGTDVQNWPQITPIAKLDLLHTDIDKGPWAMSLTPMQFCRKYDLIEEKTENGKVIAVLKKGVAHRVFALQLGPLWHSLEKLPPHIQALFAIFAARTNHDSEGSNTLLVQIAESSAGGKLDFTGTRELLVKHAGSKLVGRAVGKHAYVFTVMASMLELARTDGVLATAEFLWLKPYDRKLWYVLNNVGRQTAVPEISGIFSHWRAEQRFERPLKVPMVDQSVRALEAALEEILYEPEEDE